MPRGYKTRVCANVKCEQHGKDQIVGNRIFDCPSCKTPLQEPPK
jgi:hypothetical protein